MSKDKLILLFFTSILLIFLSDVFLLQYNFLELFKILIGPFIFISYPKIKKYFGVNELILFGLFIIILYLIFKFKVPYVFDYSCGTLEFFIKRLSCENSINLSTPPFLIASEPSYLSLMLIFYLLILIFFSNNVPKSKKIIIKTLELLILIIIYETNSRIGTLFIIFYTTYYIIISSKVRFISLIFLILISASFITQLHSYKVIGYTQPKNDYINSEGIVQNDEKYLVSSRRILNFNEFIKVDKTVNFQHSFLDIFSKVELTGFIRFLHNYLSFLAFMKEPMGYGIGSYPLIWFKHVDQNNLDNTIKKNEVIKNWYDQGIENKRQYIQNYFFTILHDGGLLPSVFLMIFYLFLYTRH